MYWVKSKFVFCVINLYTKGINAKLVSQKNKLHEIKLGIDICNLIVYNAIINNESLIAIVYDKTTED